LKSDPELIAETLAGNQAAFGQLVTKYQERLYHTAVHLLGSPEDALDVVQDTFVQAFVKLESFRGSSAFYTWLYRIAINQSIGLRRRRKPMASVDRTRETTGEEPLDTIVGPDRRLLQQERAEQLHEALAALSEEHRAILVLREMEGCDYEAIGEILELPVGTVRSRLHRARMQLKELLKTVMQEETS
jgi:RNA polymerase sigma-70 factor (ECF subfamily)